MGRPVNEKWSGPDAAGSQFMVIAFIPGQGSPAECTIVRQKTSRSFLVALDSNHATQGICRLVNKKEQAGQMNTNVPGALAEGEMIMNCKKKAGNGIRRVMKIMNRTLIYSDDDTPEANDDNGKFYKNINSGITSKWSFSQADRAEPDATTEGVTEVVQLEEAAMANADGSFVND